MNPRTNNLTKTKIVAALYAMFLGMVGYLIISWWFSPPAKARHLAPLLAEIDNIKTITGKYPDSYLSFSSYSNLTKQLTVYAGNHDTNGIVWDPHEVSGHDFTVLLAEDGYEVFLPVGRIKMVSFSSFPVDRKSVV